jgi:5'-methylthioadenosine phosphorylase
VLAVSAVGSLREEYAPGHLVAPNQLIDRTRGTRHGTFFGEGVVAHVSFAEPFCGALRSRALAAARDVGATAHNGGAYVTIEGPAFGTRAESELYRSWGASLVGMTAIPEAKLAREAELCYAMLAAVTDYDAWHEAEEAVDATTVMKRLAENVEVSRAAVARLAAGLADDGCDCGTALDAGLVTPAGAIPAEIRERLAPILARRLGSGGA